MKMPGLFLCLMQSPQYKDRGKYGKKSLSSCLLSPSSHGRVLFRQK
jgi:hypothetical protein